MSAEILRRASARIRRDAERMPAGPYGMTSAWTTPNTMLSRVTRKGEVVAEVRGRDGDGQGCYTVMYFAAWHPAVALAVADWLDVTAQRADELTDALPNSPEVARSVLAGALIGYSEALTVARTYLGERP